MPMAMVKLSLRFRSPNGAPKGHVLVSRLGAKCLYQIFSPKKGGWTPHHAHLNLLMLLTFKSSSSTRHTSVVALWRPTLRSGSTASKGMARRARFPPLAPVGIDY